MVGFSEVILSSSGDGVLETGVQIVLDTSDGGGVEVMSINPVALAIQYFLSENGDGGTVDEDV